MKKRLYGLIGMFLMAIVSVAYVFAQSINTELTFQVPGGYANDYGMTIEAGKRYGFYVKVNNYGNTAQKIKIGFVDGTITNDEYHAKACKDEGDIANFGKYISWSDGIYTIPAKSNALVPVNIKFPVGFVGNVKGCVTHYISSSSTNASVFGVMSRKANFIDVNVVANIGGDDNLTGEYGPWGGSMPLLYVGGLKLKVSVADGVRTTITDMQTCTDPDGCVCYGNDINNGVLCTDGTRTTITDPQTCTDPDGCVCYGNDINNGVSCTDGTRTTITDMQTCSDPDGCVCYGNNINNAVLCTDGIKTIVTKNQTCSDLDGCTCYGLDINTGTICTTDGIRTVVTKTQTCTDPDGCTCYGNNINENVVCTTDGIRTVVTNGQICTDPDGCTCNGNNINENVTCTISGGGGGGGGGGGPTTDTHDVATKDNCPLGDYSPSNSDGSCGQTPYELLLQPTLGITDQNLNNALDIGKGPITRTCEISRSPYTVELNQAYLYSCKLGITTMPTILQADMEGPLLRKHLAKMSSEYAMQVVGKVPDNSRVCEFSDMANETKEFQYYAKLSCKLGVMGLQSDGTPDEVFNPNGIVTRAIFGTVFSRLIFGGKYNVPLSEAKTNDDRFKKHLQGLNIAEIMKKINQPYMKELRGWVMIMMMRADLNGTIEKEVNAVSSAVNGVEAGLQQ